MRLSALSPLLIPAALVLLTVLGCEGPHEGPTLADARTIAQAKKRPVAPAPKTIDDVVKLGVPVYPGTVMAEGEGASSLTDGSFSRVYELKMFAPAKLDEVAANLIKALKNAANSGGTDYTRITAKTDMGDEIEFRLGPAADHSKTLVMAWVTQLK